MVHELLATGIKASAGINFTCTVHHGANLKPTMM
jgi:hypothetical protein